jgi:F-type H+-transporting ATPase subunit a
MLVLFVPMALGIVKLGFPKGLFANAIEAVCLYIRDNAAIPAIGEHHATRYLPYLWTVFFFILINNLLGLIPWLGSATGALGTTAALALCSLVLIHGSGIAENGLVPYLKSIVPPVPTAIYPLMLIIEVIGHFIRPTVLAFRLFVNMAAGHTLLFVLMAFIAATGASLLNLLVAPLSLAGIVAFSLLEILVAFLQAYVFTFLSAIFIGAALHPHH